MGLCVSGTRRMVGASERSETQNPASCSAAPSSPWITTLLWWVADIIFVLSCTNSYIKYHKNLPEGIVFNYYTSNILIDFKEYFKYFPSYLQCYMVYFLGHQQQSPDNMSAGIKGSLDSEFSNWALSMWRTSVTFQMSEFQSQTARCSLKLCLQILPYEEDLNRCNLNLCVSI